MYIHVGSIYMYIYIYTHTHVGSKYSVTNFCGMRQSTQPLTFVKFQQKK